MKINLRQTGAWLKHEIKSMLSVWAFFLVAFSLLGATERAILGAYGIEKFEAPAIIFGSFVIAKVFIVVEKLPFVSRYHEKPLIYDILWKTYIFTVSVILFRYLEHIVKLLLQHHSLSEANEIAFSHLGEPRYWVIQVWIVLLLFFFCALRELSRIVGKDRIRELFFASRDKQP